MPKARNKGKVGASAEFITQGNETQMLKHSNQNREAKIRKVEWCGKSAKTWQKQYLEADGIKD